MRKNTRKGIVALLVVATVALSLFLSKVSATNEYIITFTCGNNHGMNTAGGTGLVVDGFNIAPVNATTGNAVEYSVVQEGDAIKMTIVNGEEVKLQYSNERNFDFYHDGNVVTEDTSTQGAITYVVGDKYVACTLNFACASANGNTLTYEVGETPTQVTVTVPNTLTVSNKSVTGNFNTVKDLTLTVGNFDPDTMAMYIEGPENYRQQLAVSNGSVALPGNGLPNGASSLTLKIEDTSEQPEPPQPGEPFDGNAYFMWVSNGKLCYHRFTGLIAGGPGGYSMNYINVDELTDESGNDGVYVWKQNNANWVLARDVEASAGVLKPDVDIAYVFGDGHMDMGCQLNPCCDNDGENSICSNGDMNFRSTIYREGYQALVFPTSSEMYTYFPWFFDDTFFSPMIDISGTSASNPAVYKAYILNDVVTFSVGSFSASEEVTSVKPLNVSDGAVTVTHAGENWRIKFHSRYYDHVVFEVTMADGSKGYIRIARLSIYAIDNFRPNQTNNQVIGLLSYPSTMNASDYDVVATVVKKDGTRATSVVSAGELPEGDTRLEQPGKGLKVAAYHVDVDSDTAGVYFTVVNKGALEGDVYGGTFSGSGRGIYYDIEDESSATFRDMRYDA